MPHAHNAIRFEFEDNQGVMREWTLTSFAEYHHVSWKRAREVYTSRLKTWDEWRRVTGKGIPANAIACVFDDIEFDSISALHRYLETQGVEVSYQTAHTYYFVHEIRSIEELHIWRENQYVERAKHEIRIVGCNKKNAPILMQLYHAYNGDRRSWNRGDDTCYDLWVMLYIDDTMRQQLQLSDLVVGSFEFTNVHGDKQFRLTSRGYKSLMKYLKRLSPVEFRQLLADSIKQRMTGHIKYSKAKAKQAKKKLPAPRS